MFDTQAHDFAFDGEGTQTLTSASWHGTTWQLGLGGATRGRHKIRPLVRQTSGSALFYVCSTARITTSYDALSEMGQDANADPFGLRMTFANTMAKNKWARGLFLNKHLQLRFQGEEAHWFLLLSPHGWGLWRDLEVVGATGLSNFHPKIGEGEFEWAGDEEDWLRTASATDMAARVESLAQAADADINFARRFASQSLSQRRDWLWNWKCGNEDELSRVLRLALLSQEELWREVSSVSWEVDIERGLDRQWRGGRLHSPVGGQVPDSLPFLKSALLRVLEHFGPRRNTELEEKYLSLRRLASVRTRHVLVEAREPSAHERLEATLEWREWLEESGA